MKRFLNWVWSIFEVIIIVYVIAITCFILCRNEHGFTQFGEYTFDNISLTDERNIHDVKKGDLLIIKNSNDIKVGDMIYYYAVYNDKYVIKTNAVTKIEKDDFTNLYTLNDEDGIIIASTRVLGKYASRHSHLGAILDVLESKIGFLFLVLLPIMVVFIYQVYEFIVIIRYERNEEEDDDGEDKPTNNKKTDNIEVL